MNKDFLKEAIKFYTELLKLTFVLSIGLSAGLFALVLKSEKTNGELLGLYLGIGGLITFLNITVYLFITVIKLLSKLKESN